MTDRHASNTHIQEYCQLFLEAHEPGVDVTKVPKLSGQRNEDVLMHAKFTADPLRMARQELH
jgi:hypothetical protein